MSSSMKVKRRLFSAAEEEGDEESLSPLVCLRFLRVRFSGAETADERTTTETVSFGHLNLQGKVGNELMEGRRRVDIWIGVHATVDKVGIKAGVFLSGLRD